MSGLPFHLGNYQVFSIEFGVCRFSWQLAIVVRDLSYLSLERGALCLDTSVWMPTVSHLGFPIVWCGIVVSG